jgi:hypothetical protein
MNNTKLTLTSSAIAALALAVAIGGAPLRAAAPVAGNVASGEQRRWTVTFLARLEQAGGARPVEIDLSGDWLSTVSAARPDEYDVMLQLANVRLNGTNSVPAAQSEQLRQHLERPFWVTYRADGSLAAVYFYKDTDPGDRNLLQMVATECQFVNAPADRQSWTAIERDGVGRYTAAYRRDGNVVTKHKLNYTDSAGAIRVSIDSSEMRFTVDRDGAIESVDGSNRVRLEAAFGKSGALAAITEMHLSSLHRAQAPEMIGGLARALPEVVGSPVQTHKQDPEVVRARLDSQLLEGRTTDSLLRAALPGNAPEDQTIGDRLAALFRQRPESPAAAVELLRRNGPVMRITDALGTAGSPAAIAALGVIACDRALPRPLRIDALTALMLNQHPSARALRVPTSLMDDGDAAVASAARISGGALARAGREGHPEEAASIDAALVARYRQAHDAKERCDLLAALGNSAGDAVAPVIEEALHDPEDAIRSAAAAALRLVSGAGIDGLLANIITGDRDAEVRASAIFAAGFHRPIGPRLVQSVTHAAKTDPADQVRVAALTLLQQNAAVVSNLAETLAWVAEHDAKPGVRRLAQDALKK